MEMGLEAGIRPNGGPAETRSEACVLRDRGRTPMVVIQIWRHQVLPCFCASEVLETGACTCDSRRAAGCNDRSIFSVVSTAVALVETGVEQVGSHAEGYCRRCKLGVGILKRVRDGHLEVLGERNATVMASVELLVDVER
jgi:hypothetical protein